MKKVIQKVGNYDMDFSLLEKRLTQPIPSFNEELEKIQLPDGRNLFFQDNGGDVLAVAHLDATMNPVEPCFLVPDKGYFSGHSIVCSTTVDDRLGVFTILDILPKAFERQGLPKVDVLLTEDEEIMQSTAAYFNGKKEGRYNWMFQFDRGGTDVVHYQYREFEWLKNLQRVFGQVSHGIGSDICFLEHLDCMGVNIGTAYYDYTSPHAFASLTELSEMIDRFVDFYTIFHKRGFFRPAGQISNSHHTRSAYYRAARQGIAYSAAYGWRYLSNRSYFYSSNSRRNKENRANANNWFSQAKRSGKPANNKRERRVRDKV